MEERLFDIVGYNGRPITCEHIIPSLDAESVALVLPGAGYSADRPLLYFTTDILLKKNHQVVIAHTNYSRFSDYRTLLERKDQDSALKIVLGEAQAIGDALSKKGIRPKFIVGKSIGTRAMQVLVPYFNTQKNVWFTPALSDWPFLKRRPKSDLVIIGTADQFYAQAQDFFPENTWQIPGADHSLEYFDDMPRTIETLGKIMERITTHFSLL